MDDQQGANGSPTSRRLSRPTWWFVAGYAVSAVGTGACYPFLAIYLRDTCGLSAHLTALSLLVLAGIAIPTSILGGQLCDRTSLRGVSVSALGVQAVGWLVMTLTGGGGLAVTLVAVALVGFGTGLFMPTVLPFLHGLTATSAARTRALSLRYLLMNLGLGAGAGIGAIALGSATAATFRWLFTANAASCLVYAGIILAAVTLPASPPATTTSPDNPAAGSLWRNTNLLLLLAAQLLLVTFGLTQIESGIPLLLRARLGVSPTLIGALYALGTLTIVLAQLPVSHLVERVHKTRALIALCGMWTLAWLLGSAAGHSGQHFRAGLLIATIVAFTLGECVYSPALYTLVPLLSATRALGSSSGAVWAAFNLGSTIGPPLAVLVVDSTVSLWLVLIAAATLSAAILAILDRRMHAHLAPGPPPMAATTPT